MILKSETNDSCFLIFVKKIQVFGEEIEDIKEVKILDESKLNKISEYIAKNTIEGTLARLIAEKIISIPDSSNTKFKIIKY